MDNVNLKVVFLSVSLTGGLLSYGIASAGGRGAPTPLPPTIVKTAVNLQEKTLIIVGSNFGATQPSVTLANQVLDVRRFSEREVVANLPRGLTAATYGVTVTTSGRNRINSNLFSAALPDIDKQIDTSQEAQAIQ